MRLRSLRSKLLVAVSALVIIISVLISLLVTHRYGRSLYQAATAHAENLAHWMALEVADKILINDLVALPQMKRNELNGADQIAEYIVRMLEGIRDRLF